MKIKYIYSKKNFLLWLGILIILLLIIIVWSKISKNRYPSINLEKYRYEREFEDSPCISPSGSYVLKILAVYNQPMGGKGYILGFVYNRETNEKKWVYLQNCILNVCTEVQRFNVYGGGMFYWKGDRTVAIDTLESMFYWKDDSTVVIGTHEINIQAEETYYFNKDSY